MTSSPRPARWRLPLRVVAAVLVAVAVLCGGAGPALAHADLISSDPTDGAVVAKAPETVMLTFNEAVRLTSQTITVYDAAGDAVVSESSASGSVVRIELPAASALAEGTYTVGWNVLSGDGHPIAGSLTFSIGAPSASVTAPPPPAKSSAAVTITRDLLAGLTYLALLLAGGLAMFLALVLPTSYSGSRVRGRLRTVATYAAGTAVVTSLLLVPLSWVYAQGLELSGLVSGFDPGLVINEIIFAALVLIGLGVVIRALSDQPPTTLQRRILVGGVLVALSGPAAAGHTRAFDPSALLMLSDVLHLAAGAFWLGGLVGLALSLPALAGREVLAATTLARFSTLAGGILLVVAATGSFLSWRILGSWSVFVETTYGRLLLVKIAIALIVAGVGGWNRWRTLPAVRDAVGFGDRGRAAALVTRTVRVEAILIVVLLGVTGFLVNQSPRPAPVEVNSGSTGVGASLVDDLRVLAVMDPQERGSNVLLIQLQDVEGEPYDPPTPPEVSVRTAGLNLGKVQVTAISNGTYRGEVILPRDGVWEVQVSIRLSRFESPVTTVRLKVPR